MSRPSSNPTTAVPPAIAAITPLLLDDEAAAGAAAGGGDGAAGVSAVTGVSDSVADSESLSSEFFPMRLRMAVEGEKKV